jgi:hypothetical protein
MKKEITGWTTMASIYGSDKIISIHKDVNTVCSHNPIKVTLTYEVDRKTEISESQLRDCFDEFPRFENDHDRQLVYRFYEFSKQKLFGGSENL